MPGLLMHLNAVMQCTHGAKANVLPSQVRVLISGQAVAVLSSPATPIATVAGCPFQIPVGAGTKPQPCITVKWTMPSTRFLLGGLPAALVPAPGPGPGICQSAEQIPQGPPIVGTVQTRVIGT